MPLSSTPPPKPPYLTSEEFSETLAKLNILKREQAERQKRNKEILRLKEQELLYVINIDYEAD
jgi:hypothetical protein